MAARRRRPRPAGARRLPPLVAVATAAALAPLGVQGAGGLTDDERLLHSDGLWHRAQRKRVAFETSCYYTHEPELPYGCQVGAQDNDEWKFNTQRRTEKQVLLDLYDNTEGGNWRANDNWGLDTDPCWDAWYGVTCDEHGLVIYLELSDNNLVGQLPGNLGQLRSLLKLDLSTSAPDYHAHVNEYANRITGMLPSLSAATRLEEIEISGNEFSGLPADLYLNAPTLRSLSAAHNRLLSLPRHLRRFTQLHTLELNNNMIQDLWPTDFGFLTNVRFVNLQYNLLSGMIGETVSGMSRIRVLDVSHNIMLSGTIPEDISVQWPENDYLSILNTTIGGYISSLCIDVPFCWRFMYDTHRDLTWATAVDVPDIVNLTVELALRNAAQQAADAAGVGADEVSQAAANSQG